VQVVGDAVCEPRVVDADLLSIARQVQAEQVAPFEERPRPADE
jgi:hypothetical protein